MSDIFCGILRNENMQQDFFIIIINIIFLVPSSFKFCIVSVH